MGNVLKAALTTWYALLTGAFIFGAAAAFMTLMTGFTEPRDEYVGAGAFALFSFGWGARTYLGKFLARVDDTQKAAAKDWDDEDDEAGL